jgi:hypothetical protein
MLMHIEQIAELMRHAVEPRSAKRRSS